MAPANMAPPVGPQPEPHGRGEHHGPRDGPQPGHGPRREHPRLLLPGAAGRRRLRDGGQHRVRLGPSQPARRPPAEQGCPRARAAGPHPPTLLMTGTPLPTAPTSPESSATAAGLTWRHSWRRPGRPAWWTCRTPPGWWAAPCVGTSSWSVGSSATAAPPRCRAGPRRRPRCSARPRGGPAPIHRLGRPFLSPRRPALAQRHLLSSGTETTGRAHGWE